MARLYTNPVEVVSCQGPDQIDEAFVRLELGLQQGLHAAGFLSYELGHGLEPRLRPLMPRERADPLMWMGLFPAPHQITSVTADAFFAALPPPQPLTDMQFGNDRASHATKVERILDLIAAGDIYQANLTFPIRFRYGGPPLSLYAALRVSQPTAHAGIVANGEIWALSISPELFLQVAGGRAESRPMKGTAPRGAGAQDKEAVRALLADPKQRAENLMITDLIRNDLSRISEPGSVRTPRLFTVESHPTFHALTSTVTSRLRPAGRLRDRIAAVFPCGSIVGAPKIRAAEVLAELEQGSRGLYTGAIGSFGPEGDIDLNVAIRTAVVRADGTGVYGVGGGVVADSDPDAEYEEARLKARVLEDLVCDYGLIETLRWSASDGFVRLGRHLDRLATSAAALGFLFGLAGVENELAGRAEAWAAARMPDRRVRLLLPRTGVATIEDVPAPAKDARPPRVGVASVTLDAGDPFLRHKTTRREAYDAATTEAVSAGWNEALLLNRAGEVADAARHSVFVQIGGFLVTPPLAAGALPGILRAELIDDGRVVERTITLAEVAASDALFIGNSLRGLSRAAFVRDGAR